MEAPIPSDLQLVAIYIDAAGRPRHTATQQVVRFAPGAQLHLLLQHAGQLLPEPEPFITKYHQVVPSEGILTFVLHQTPWGKAEVTVQFPQGLIMQQDKPEEKPHCPEQVACLITDVRALSNPMKSVPGFSPIAVTSVNHAYTEASKRFEPARKSNGANIYRHMKTRDGQLLLEAWNDFEKTKL